MIKKVTKIILAIFLISSCEVRHLPKDNESRTRQELEIFVHGLNLYKKDIGVYPRNLNELFKSNDVDEHLKERWNGPYLWDHGLFQGGKHLDWFSNEIIYKRNSDGQGLELRSAGVDGRLQSEDDIIEIVTVPDR